MVQTIVYNTKAEKISSLSLPDKIFKLKINKVLIAQAVRVYLSNQRQAPAKAKTRGEVKGSGKKIYRQKGTGRARHGDRKAPIFVKGGKAHGPTGQQNYKLKMSKKMRKTALFSALSSKLESKQLIIIDGLEKIQPKTKEMVKIIKNVNQKIFQSKLKKNGKIVMVLPKAMENIVRSGSNIKGLSLAYADLLNTYKVLDNQILILMKSSIEVIKQVFIKEKVNLK